MEGYIPPCHKIPFTAWMELTAYYPIPVVMSAISFSA
jgi:hypothetical protein